MNFKIADNKFKELLLPTLLIVMALNISAVVDSFFVGAYIGKDAVAALEVLEPMILLITVVEWLFGLGGQILALNKKAEFDEDGSNRYFTVSMVLSFIASLIMAIICLIFMGSKEILEFTVKTGEGDKVFGSISIKPIKEELSKRGYQIEKSMIEIPTPIASLGFHNVNINLYPEITATIKVHVVK